MDTTHHPHPSPGYWINQGYRHALAGNFLPLTPDEYPQVFSDDDPPTNWVEAFNVGQAQGVHEFWNQDAAPSTSMGSPRTSIRNRLADRLRHLAEAIDRG